MNRQYGETRFTSFMIENLAEGYVGYELTQIQHGKSNRIARIIFWDATGQFAVETFGGDVPLEILEELIVEAKTTIITN